MMPNRRIVITGAAGNLGAKLARHLASRADIVAIDRPEGDLSVWQERWAERFAGAHTVFHFAGDPTAYHGWDELVGPNVDAMLNVYEAAARYHVRRFVFASSNHVMGGYQGVPGVPITTDLPPKPGLRYVVDGIERFSGPYAATKLFGERTGRLYALTRGMTVICARIGWVWRGNNIPQELPADRGEWFRNMWLSDRDFLHLMDCCLTAELQEPFVIVNGMSRNAGMRWDLDSTARILGYQPRDNVNQLTG
jgi:uronate dehydrogenase